jgi:HlyD family secretion protein
MTLSVEVETARSGRTLVLPLEALRSDDGAGGATAWVDDGGRVALRTLRLGVRTLDAVEVLDGVGAGDKVLLGEAPEPGGRVRADVGPGVGSLPAVPAGAAAKPAAKGRADDAGSALGNAMGR